MDSFEALLTLYRLPVERYVKFRISSHHDAQDVLQEIWTAACAHPESLPRDERCLPFLLGIARHKCADYFRRRSGRKEFPADPEALPQQSCIRSAACSPVNETLLQLSQRDREILRLCYWLELPQSEIAQRLHLPLGTVKSRLHTARERFRRLYPQRMITTKGASVMKKLPKTMPDYIITRVDELPFPVRWEETVGCIVPRLGEQLVWGLYDFPQRTLTEWADYRVTGRALIHGIEGVEIESIAHNPMECSATDGKSDVTRTFVAQLTDTHCRILAETHMQNGVKRMYTFLDGDAFLNNWGFGKDNCGNEVNIVPKGDIVREGNMITAVPKEFLLDVVGRYAVTINGKTYDTICVMDIEAYNDGAVTEQFIDRSGRTVLWRRFNPDEWNIARYGKPWTEILPGNERITVNGKTCVHWYDCITSYIL